MILRYINFRYLSIYLSTCSLLQIRPKSTFFARHDFERWLLITTAGPWPCQMSSPTRGL